MDRHKQLVAKLAADLADLESHQESTFERLRQALQKIQLLEMALKDSAEAIKTLEARIKELEGEMEEMVYPDELADLARERWER